MVVRRLPLNKIPKQLNDNEYYLVAARVFVKGAAMDSGIENVNNHWQFKPSNKVRKLPLETVEDTIAYENAFYDQLERNNRIEEFKALIDELESKYDIVNIICSCDNTYVNDYCHVKSLLKLLVKPKPVFDWNADGYDFDGLPEDREEFNSHMKDWKERKRSYDRNYINKLRGVDL